MAGVIIAFLCFKMKAESVFYRKLDQGSWVAHLYQQVTVGWSPPAPCFLWTTVQPLFALSMQGLLHKLSVRRLVLRHVWLLPPFVKVTLPNHP